MDEREGIVTKVGKGWELRFKRRLNHPADKVWAALTGPGQMSQWFDEAHFPDTLEVGAVIRFYHAIVDRQSEGRITRLDPPHLIEWLWSGPFGKANLIRWEIAAAPEGSILTLMQQIDDPAILARTTAGWHICLDRMQALLDGAEIQSHMEGWQGLFERYSARLKAAGVTTPQLGAPPKPPPRS